MGYHLKAETFTRVGFKLVSEEPANELWISRTCFMTKPFRRINDKFFKDCTPLFQWDLIRFNQVKGSRCHLASLRFICSTANMDGLILVKELLNEDAIEGAKFIRRVQKQHYESLR